MAKPAGATLIQTLRRYVKKPWEITGPCADREYRHAIPKSTEYRLECPATTKLKAIVPTSDPEAVFDIKRTVLKKANVVKMMKEQAFKVVDLPLVYLAGAVEEDINTRGGGYQK
ncbi:unnamed protein product [Linum trigynum]|uniref:Uncharacterized protein n=1 Tax=Linum trigynum TaxID=586398 RepID=A0AAV2GMF2_9ROSI